MDMQESSEVNTFSTLDLLHSLIIQRWMLNFTSLPA